MKRLSLVLAVLATALATPALAANVTGATGYDDSGGSAPTSTSSDFFSDTTIDNAATGAANSAGQVSELDAAVADTP